MNELLKNEISKIKRDNNINIVCYKKIDKKNFTEEKISENNSNESIKLNKYYDDIQAMHMRKLNNLKFEKEGIIKELQDQINGLIVDIDVLSNNI